MTFFVMHDLEKPQEIRGSMSIMNQLHNIPDV
jgi:hypothetical protein